MVRDIYVKLSMTPACCVRCRREFHIGQRIVTDGKNDFDSCDCEYEYHRKEITHVSRTSGR